MFSFDLSSSRLGAAGSRESQPSETDPDNIAGPTSGWCCVHGPAAYSVGPCIVRSQRRTTYPPILDSSSGSGESVCLCRHTKHLPNCSGAICRSWRWHRCRMLRTLPFGKSSAATAGRTSIGRSIFVCTGVRARKIGFFSPSPRIQRAGQSSRK